MPYKILDNCMHCERCAAQCPAKAIFYNGTCMEIDPGKCVSCGLCASICRMNAPVDVNWEPIAPVRHPLRELQCGIIVLGGGGMGMVAAAKASDLTDEKIIVLEKNANIGGGAWYARTAKIYGSNWQKEHGAGEGFLEKDFIASMDYTDYRLDPHLVYNCFRYTGEFFDWIYQGFPQEIKDRFVVGRYFSDGPEGCPVPDYVFPHPEWGNDGIGKQVMLQCERICRKNGVEILTGCRAVDVEVTDGKITAVMAEDEGGKLLIKCKACILATGSWINDRETLKKYAPRLAAATPHRSCHLNPNYTGDGIPLAEKAGALIDYDSFCTRNMGPFYYDILQALEVSTVKTISVDRRVIWVNQNGKRWVNELIFERKNIFEACVPLEYQPGGVSYTIFDTNVLEQCIRDPRTESRMTPGFFFGDGNYPENWREELDSVVAGGVHMKKADTLSGLAEQLGISADALEETICRYNRMCADGVDSDFHKPEESLVAMTTGPWYAIICHIQTDGAFGGVLVNENCQVYAKDREHLVEGLYGGGDFSSGRFINADGWKKQIINDLAWAFSSGYNAGIHAAEYVNGL